MRVLPFKLIYASMGTEVYGPSKTENNFQSRNMNSTNVYPQGGFLKVYSKDSNQREVIFEVALLEQILVPKVKPFPSSLSFT